MPVAPGTSSVLAILVSSATFISLSVESSTVYDGRGGVRWRGGRRCRYRCLLRFAISLHRSSSPSPPRAEIGRAAIPSFRSSSSEVLRALSARQLVDFRGDQDARRVRSRPASCAASISGVEPRVPRVDQVQDTGHAIPCGRRAFPARCIGVFEIGMRRCAPARRPTRCRRARIRIRAGRPDTGSSDRGRPGPPSTVTRYRLARRVLPAAALVRASVAARERVDHRRLADVGTPDQRDVRDPVGRDPSSIRSAGDELRASRRASLTERVLVRRFRTRSAACS